jgi:hypothetical protein
MSIITVCKNVIASNNKQGWKDPSPAIRISKSSGGAATGRAHEVAIMDKAGNVVATIQSTMDGQPIVKCGAKVAITTVYPARVIK